MKPLLKSFPAAGAEATAGAAPEAARGGSPVVLGAALLGFFLISLDALIVTVALPEIGRGLGGGMSGLQWVVDGYTLIFAALMLSAGALSDRIGARQAYGGGLVLFALTSAACGLAPNLGVLVAARLVQGGAAAVMMPASLALVRQGFPDQVKRARAIAIWTVGGAVAVAAGPVLGGALTASVGWRWIFFVNLPAGLLALALLARVPASPRGHRGVRQAAGQPWCPALPVPAAPEHLLPSGGGRIIARHFLPEEASSERHSVGGSRTAV